METYFPRSRGGDMITLEQARQHIYIGQFCDKLQELIYDFDCKKALEIGCAEFNSSITILSALEMTDGVLYSCDIQEPPPTSHPRFRFYHMRSDKFFQEIQAEAPFQFAFIDGDHTYEQVKRDIFHAMEVVEGPIAIHDIRLHDVKWNCQVSYVWDELKVDQEIYYENLVYPGLGVIINHLS